MVAAVPLKKISACNYLGSHEEGRWGKKNCSCVSKLEQALGGYRITN